MEHEAHHNLTLRFNIDLMSNAYNKSIYTLVESNIYIQLVDHSQQF